MTRTFANGFARGADGNLSILTGINACVQNCQTAMLAQVGEMIYNLTGGVPYMATVWTRYNAKAFAAAARKTLLAVTDVTAVKSFTATRSADTLIYVAEIQTIYGTATVTNG